MQNVWRNKRWKKQRDEKTRQINELRKQLEELEQAQDQEDEELQVDDEQWAEYDGLSENKQKRPL